MTLRGGESLWREQLAWAAGFFDGEGSFTANSRRWRQARTCVVQVERAPLERFQDAVLGRGRIQGPYRNGWKENHRPRFMFNAGWADTQAVVAMLWPWLGTTKRDQARRVLLQSREQWPLHVRDHWLVPSTVARRALKRCVARYGSQAAVGRELVDLGMTPRNAKALVGRLWQGQTQISHGFERLFIEMAER